MRTTRFLLPGCALRLRTCNVKRRTEFPSRNDMTTKDAIAAARTRMEKALEDFRKEAATLRTGRANAMLLDGIRVDYHGTLMPLNQLGTMTVPDATMIVIAPWDPTVVALIDKAIRIYDLGLNPTNDGKVVRVPIPGLTEERR